MGLRDRVAALLGISAYAAQMPAAAISDESLIESVREHAGGNLQRLPTTQTRWYLRDLERAQSLADSGDLSVAAQLCAAFRTDGTIGGLLGTRTSGLVSLPKRYRGKAGIVEALTAETSTRSVFDEMFPPSELALLDADGVNLGVGVAELVPVRGRDYPVMVRLEPEFLRYRWNDGRWYFNSIAGALPITPGDGRWILHVPGGRQTPWRHGNWRALGRSFINKEHALLHRSNYSGKLANPARLAFAPAGATEQQRIGFLARLIAWGVNSVFELPPGWDAKLLESNGRGWEVFTKEIETSDLEAMISLAGQIVTVTGGTGFANADIHKTIRADIIKTDGDGLSYTLNTQGIPQFVIRGWGEDALAETARVEWDTKPPKDQAQEANALTSAANAIERLAAVLSQHERGINVDELIARFGIPAHVMARVAEETKKIQLDLAPADLAKVVRAKEARASRGLPPFGDERDEMTIPELEAQGQSKGDELGAQEATGEKPANDNKAAA